MDFLKQMLTENSTEILPKFNLNISLSNLSIAFKMMVPHQDDTKYPNLTDFLDDLKFNISGESEISGWCFWLMIFLYIIVASMGLIGNGLGKFLTVYFLPSSLPVFAVFFCSEKKNLRDFSFPLLERENFVKVKNI